MKFPLNVGILIISHKIRFLDFKVDQFLDSWISADASYEIYPLKCYTPLRLNLIRPPHISYGIIGAGALIKKNNNLENQGSKFELTATCRQTWLS